ncbi:MAG: hypothetical protein J6P13_00040 [Kiritimatiellae bacterium]|nr:hypothetical protein [Kiritimatiellia bacterium]
MTTDYIVASLPPLAFGEKPALSREKFDELAAHRIAKPLEKWRDLETQLRNAMASCRGGAEKYLRHADGCSVYWKSRIEACFQEKDVAKRDEMLDRVWWDAAGELVPPASPLGDGALAAYSIRLDIAIKRAMISRDKGAAIFDSMTNSQLLTSNSKLL